MSSSSSSTATSIRSQLLLERLRAKSGQLKTFPDLSKSLRTAMLDRRFSLDQVEKGILQKCLDSLQEKIPVRSAQGMAERLETIGRKIGLKFMAAPVHGCYYLSTEIFYVEINIDAGSGNVNEAKINHIDATQTSQYQNSQSCPEIIECLSKGDFATFIRHLEGLVSVYNLAQATAPEKSKAWLALQAVEHDLEAIFHSYRSWPVTDAFSLVAETPLGLVHPRSGGLPMRLRFHLAPHELIDKENKALLPCTVENIVDNDLGQVVTVMLEKSENPCLLPMVSLLRGKQGFEEMNVNNSFSLPARFILQLKSPMPISLEKCKEITQLTNFSFADKESGTPMLQLIVKNRSNNQLDNANNRGLFVTLPDQQHCYFLSDTPDFVGVLVSSIPFSHPAHVQDILAMLRQQVAFNTLVESCVRVNSIQDLEKSIMFEVSSTDLQHLSITFEHPAEECVQTIDLDLTNILHPKCTIYSANSEPICTEELANKIIERCMSIPITMRSLVRRGQGQAKVKQANEEAISLSLANISNGNNGNKLSSEDGNKSTAAGAEMNGFKYGLSSSSSAYGKVEDNERGAADQMLGSGEIKSEPMEFENYETEPLNTHGPQNATFNPEAFISPATSSNSSSSRSILTSSHKQFKSKSLLDSGEVQIKAEMGVSPSPSSSAATSSIEPEFLLTKSSQPPKSMEHSPVKKEVKKEQPPMLLSTTDIKPSFSITPVSGSGIGQSPMLTPNKSKSGGIEIIPLGGSSGGGSNSDLGQKSSSRDIRRSLSEDDKRRQEKKSSSSSSKKRKHDASFSRGEASSSSKKKYSDSPDSRGKSSSSFSTKSLDPPKTNKLASVIDRLAQSSAETGIEILPASSSSSTPSKSPKPSKPSSTTGSSSSSSLKLTLKTVNKHSSSGSSKTKSPPSSKDKPSLSSSSKHKSSSSGQSYLLSSSSHRHSSSSSSKSKSSTEKDRKRYHDRVGASGGVPTNSSSTSAVATTSPATGGSMSNRDRSSGSQQREKDWEGVKKLLDGGKLNKTFQIPKISKGSSPSTSKPEPLPSSSSTRLFSSGGNSSGTSPKYASVSPKQQLLPQLPNSSSTSPKYIGGGSVTPPNISPKHSYSAPSSIVGQTRSSPLNTSPKGNNSRTPSASPTHTHRYPLPPPPSSAVGELQSSPNSSSNFVAAAAPATPVVAVTSGMPMPPPVLLQQPSPTADAAALEEVLDEAMLFGK